MDCESTLDNMQAYLDGDLDGAQQAAIAVHLRSCASCSRMVADVREMSDLLRTYDAPRPNLPTGQQVLARAATPQGFLGRAAQWLAGWRLRPISAGLTAAAGCALIAGTLGVIYETRATHPAPLSPVAAGKRSPTAGDPAANPAANRSVPPRPEISRSSDDPKPRIAVHTPPVAQPHANGDLLGAAVLEHSTMPSSMFHPTTVGGAIRGLADAATCHIPEIGRSSTKSQPRGAHESKRIDVPGAAAAKKHRPLQRP